MTTTPPETPVKAPPPWEKNPDGTALLLSEVSDDKGENKRLKLVYLRYVLLWLMQVEGLHFSVAARDMHKKLTGLAGLGLYLLEAGGNACLVGVGDRFNLGREIHQRRFSGGGLDADYQPIPIKRHAKQPPKFVLPEGVTLGQSAALYFWERVVGGGEFTESDFDKPGWQGTKLAVSCEQAELLWGHLVVAETVKTEPKLTGSEEWTGERLQAQQNVFKAQGLRDYTKRTAQMSGVEDTEIRRRIAQVHKAKTSVVQSIFPAAKTTPSKAKRSG